ncbi:MAG: hypothetical protein IJP92_10950 [Lachnospiraceae bacterium]|nr:hypothetical protein [Lachnospiraceae bacterium]
MKSTKKRICIPLRRMAAAWMLMTVVLCAPVIAKAATPLNSANFDSRTYADTYADLKAAFGYDHNMLWKHYQTYGANEQRRAYATNGDIGYLGTAQTPAAAGNAALNADNFDYRRYADTYADLKAAFGYDKAQLWNHYRTFGAREGRKVFTTGGATAVAAAAQPAANTAPPALVPLSELKQQPTFNRYMNDAEFEAAYAAAKPVVEQWLGLSKKD